MPYLFFTRCFRGNLVVLVLAMQFQRAGNGVIYLRINNRCGHSDDLDAIHHATVAVCDSMENSLYQRMAMMWSLNCNAKDSRVSREYHDSVYEAVEAFESASTFQRADPQGLRRPGSPRQQLQQQPQQHSRSRSLQHSRDEREQQPKSKSQTGKIAPWWRQKGCQGGKTNRRLTIAGSRRYR